MAKLVGESDSKEAMAESGSKRNRLLRQEEAANHTATTSIKKPQQSNTIRQSPTFNLFLTSPKDSILQVLSGSGLKDFKINIATFSFFFRKKNNLRALHNRLP
jgi:hypothetical protein